MEQMATPTALPRLLIPRPVYSAMLAQAAAEAPNECGGLLGGTFDDGGGLLRAESCLPLVNAAASPTEYESEPRSLFAALRTLRQAGHKVVAIYHSHPAAPPVPSRTDLARNYWGRVVNLIISLQNAQPEVRGWWLSETGYRPADWEAVD
jgi:proteasome lid subunit RPN8/RPN11